MTTVDGVHAGSPKLRNVVAFPVPSLAWICPVAPGVAVAVTVRGALVASALTTTDGAGETKLPLAGVYVSVTGMLETTGMSYCTAAATDVPCGTTIGFGATPRSCGTSLE